MDDKIYTTIKKDTQYSVPRKSVADHRVLTVTWDFKYIMGPDLNTNKFKALYCLIWDSKKISSPELLSMYSMVVLWAT